MKIMIDKRKISGNVNVFKFIDKDTNQFIAYIPSFELSGYGVSAEMAMEMLEFSLQDFFRYLSAMPFSNIENELTGYGWKRGVLNEFSKPYTHIGTDLNTFNARNNQVEIVTLTAA